VTSARVAAGGGEGTRPSDAGSAAGRKLLFAGLYFAEGAPIGFVWWALPVWLHNGGSTPGEIARVMALVTWPWALKFLWAPLVDLLRTPRFGLRAWIVTSQFAMALALAPLVFLGLEGAGDLLLVLILLHGVAAATQDCAIDTLAIRAVPARERGAINGWMQVGMLGGRALFGGGAVLLAARIGQEAVIGWLVVAIAGPVVLAAVGAREREVDSTPRSVRLAGYRASFRDLVRRRELWGGLLFASVAGAGFEGLASLAGPLLRERGADNDTVGFFFLLPTVVLMAAGALLGGWASDRFGRRRLTCLGEALAALAVIAVGLAAWTLPVSSGAAPFLVLLGLLYFAAGVATASLYSLLMDLCDPRLAATQFCAFMAGINLCYVWATHSLGVLVDEFGYGPGIVAMGSASLVALPLLLVLRPRRAPSSSTAGASAPERSTGSVPGG
jgi:MFS family permease